MKKFIFSDNGTLADYSYQIEDYHNEDVTIPLVAAEDYIYIGARLPYNSVFFDVTTANTSASAISVEYWDGTAWRSMVEVIDETLASGVSLSRSGHVTWVTNKNYLWSMDDTVYAQGGEKITGIGDLTIYDLFWTRISFSADLDVTTVVSWMGQKFCNNSDLINEYTLFANSTFTANYKSGKTEWESEIVLASRIMVEDIIDKGSIISGEQLLDRRKLRDACVSKCAEIIFKNLGDDYINDAKKAASEYNQRISKKNYGADLDFNANIDPNEMGVKIGGLYR